MTTMARRKYEAPMKSLFVRLTLNRAGSVAICSAFKRQHLVRLRLMHRKG